AVAGGFALPNFVLGKKITARKEEILVTLPYAIDLLSISVEAGMGFDAALGYTMRKLRGPLAEEFAKTLNEIRLGKPRLE
ncbi:MAG: type II secretion system F family protein, partial [Phycisphaerae bacterium]|nr:type II secretion system F family protein [Phycisphaerae bacterium]